MGNRTHSISFRSARLALAALALLAWSALPSTAGADERGPVLVELFTSQGCSSCPPADALLGKLAKRPDVVALSFHIDYWDYIGWRDPFASAANSRRQRDYAHALGSGYVYTPEMIVGGVLETTGIVEREVLDRLDAARVHPNAKVAARMTGGNLVISVADFDRPVDAGVWVAFFDRERLTKVRRGENRGRELRNHNIVRRFERIGDWRGRAQTYHVSADRFGEDAAAADGCAVFVQTENNGAVLGATQISLRPMN